jgi:hypothetical protein
MLRVKLTENFGKLPSASKLANEYNLRARGTNTISRETARKWIRGDAFPEIDKLTILALWLGLNLNFLTTTAPESAIDLLSLSSAARILKADGGYNLKKDLLDMIDKLDADTLKVILILSITLYESKKLQEKNNLL